MRVLHTNPHHCFHRFHHCSSHRSQWSPLNGGLWTLANPSSTLYQKALALLHSASWNRTHGFALMGTPQQLFERTHSPLAASAAEENSWWSDDDDSTASALFSSPDLRRMLSGTRALARNTWAFFAADSDQGLLFHLCFVTTSIGAALPAENRARGAAVHSSLCRGGRKAIATNEDKLEARRRSHAKGSERDSLGQPPGFSGRCPHLARHYMGQVRASSCLPATMVPLQLNS